MSEGLSLKKRWIEKRKRDQFYKKARELGYKSRAAFKLKEIQRRFKIIKAGYRVLDLGAAPGGWVQVSLEHVKPDGSVVGVDIKDLKIVDPNFIYIKGDVKEENTLTRILSIHSQYDVVLSDLSPNLTGIWSLDHERQIDLCYEALNISSKVLRRGGSLVLKVFDGPRSREFAEACKSRFKKFYRIKPKASRKKSSEMYFVCLVFKG
ncbi:hypothetical protein B6U74_04060 [Candidatus Bathyarchaeota archaeon ex4484_205]|nr:MAG: hypothetical protein B6U74_04060 [Candidatus Bathyarchaeota archaeon ex4484_205]